MKILIVNTSDIIGGAARAAYRLHKALLDNDIDSQMLVQDKASDDFTVVGAKNKIGKGLAKIRPTIDNLLVKLLYKNNKTLFSPSVLPSNIVKKINDINPDIVHLHWINGGMIKIEDLAKIKAPIVWTLHDMWAFTGGCHYDENCNKYKKSCNNCPVLKANKLDDLSRYIFKRKQKTYIKINSLTIVGLSKWLADCAKESILFKNRNIVNLPNPIDTDVFKPFNKKTARELWNLPANKKLILFGAMSATADLRKGFYELTEALKKINNQNIELVVFGSSKPKNEPDLGFKAYYLGNLHDDISLTTLYNAVDVMVVPSLQENLSNAIMESLACGTPVACFDIGGNGDMVNHKTNGYLAKPFDTEDLANGIEFIINANNYAELSQNARKKVLECFDSKIVAKQYIKLYEQILR